MHDLERNLYGPKPDLAAIFYGQWEEKIKLRHGQYGLGDSPLAIENLAGYILNVRDSARVFDIIEVFLDIWNEVSTRALAPVSPSMAKAGIDEALAESDLPYRVVGTIIASEAPAVTDMVLEPAARALQLLGIGGGVEEFNRALVAQRSGDWRTVLVEASSAVESTLKWVLEELATPYDPKAAAGELINTLRAAGFFDEGPTGAEVSGVILNILQAAPSLGSRLARHGHGARARPISPAAGTLALNQAAVAILYLAQRRYEV